MKENYRSQWWTSSQSYPPSAFMAPKNIALSFHGFLNSACHWDSQSCIKPEGNHHNSHYSRMDIWCHDLCHVSRIQKSKGSTLIFILLGLCKTHRDLPKYLLWLFKPDCVDLVWYLAASDVLAWAWPESPGFGLALGSLGLRKS